MQGARCYFYILHFIFWHRSSRHTYYWLSRPHMFSPSSCIGCNVGQLNGFSPKKTAPVRTEKVFYQWTGVEGSSDGVD